MDAHGNVANKGPAAEEDDEPEVQPLDEADIEILRNYGLPPYSIPSKNTEGGIKEGIKKIQKIIGVRESDLGVGPPGSWDLEGDKQMMKQEQALQVARCTKIIDAGSDEAR